MFLFSWDTSEFLLVLHEVCGPTDREKCSTILSYTLVVCVPGLCGSQSVFTSPKLLFTWDVGVSFFHFIFSSFVWGRNPLSTMISGPEGGSVPFLQQMLPGHCFRRQRGHHHGDPIWRTLSTTGSLSAGWLKQEESAFPSYVTWQEFKDLLK